MHRLTPNPISWQSIYRQLCRNVKLMPDPEVRAFYLVRYRKLAENVQHAKQNQTHAYDRQQQHKQQQQCRSPVGPSQKRIGTAREKGQIREKTQDAELPNDVEVEVGSNSETEASTSLFAPESPITSNSSILTSTMARDDHNGQRQKLKKQRSRAISNLRQELNRSERVVQTVASARAGAGGQKDIVKALEKMIEWTYARSGSRRYELLSAVFPISSRRPPVTSTKSSAKSTAKSNPTLSSVPSFKSTLHPPPPPPSPSPSPNNPNPSDKYPPRLRSPSPLPSHLSRYTSPLRISEPKTPAREALKPLGRRRIVNAEWKERARMLRKVDIPLDVRKVLVGVQRSGGGGGDGGEGKGGKKNKMPNSDSSRSSSSVGRKDDQGHIKHPGTENGQGKANPPPTMTTPLADMIRPSTTTAELETILKWLDLGPRLNANLKKIAAGADNDPSAVPKRLKLRSQIRTKSEPQDVNKEIDSRARKEQGRNRNDLDHGKHGQVEVVIGENQNEAFVGNVPRVWRRAYKRLEKRLNEL